MTCHIAVCAADGDAVMFSDSQASVMVHDREIHGVHKQVAGADFLLGGAGSLLVVRETLRYIVGLPDSCATNVSERVRTFLEEQFDPEMRKEGHFLLVTSSGTRRRVPGMRSWLDTGPVASIGSGEAFVDRAVRRNAQIGIVPRVEHLADAMQLAASLAEASNESLTVNDQHAIGMIAGGKTYVLGHSDVQAEHAPPAIRAAWRQVGAFYLRLAAVTGTIRGELHNAQRQFSVIMRGDMPDAGGMSNAANSISMMRLLLANSIAEYMTWYDRVMGR